MGLDDPLDWLPAVPVALASVLWALYGAALSTPTLAITSTALSLCLALALQFHGHRRSRFLSARLIGQAIPVNNNNKDDKIDQPSTSKDNSLTQVSAHQQQQQQQRQTASARKEVDVDVVKTQLTNDNKSTPEELSMDDAIPSRSSSRSSSSSSRSSSSRSSVTGAPLQAVEPQQCKPLSDQWDHVVVGEGREALQAAVRLAQQHHTQSILVLLETDIQPNVAQRIVQWSQKILTSQAQRLWASEAQGPSSQHGPSHRHSDTDSDVDMASLPPNLYIGSDLRATKILIDRPMTTHAQDGQSPSKSNVDGSTLSVDTSSTPPARIIGLEYTNRTGGVYRLFCKHGVLFANGKHHLIQSLDKHVISSFDSQDTKTLSEDPGSWPRMEFSIKMQYTRQQPSTLLARKARVSTWHLLQNLSNILGLLAFSGASYHSRTTLSLDPVILFRANRAHHKGRVQSWNPDCDDEAFELEISASTVSLETTSPVQISVKVVTEPVRDTFGNAEMIRKGEAVLMEGLDLARDMARGAGWTCLAEDDSQMIEWVRDQVIIQWSRPSQESIKNVSSTLEGLTMVFRSRSSSNGSTRTKTPTLSPYASRTHSLSGKRRSKHSGGHHRDSTLERLQEAAEMLEPKKEAHGLHALLDQQNPTRKVHRKSIDRGEPEKPIVSIAAAESPSPQRASVITSFGGFSSLSDSRTQSLALAEKTEDHLGLALSIPSVREPSSPTSNSPSPKEMDPKSITSFSEGITSVDILGTGYAPSPPEPKKLSRFSIKSYQLERNNTSTDWGLGNDMGLGSNAGSPKSTSPSTTTLSRFSAYNMSPASKPKLEAEVPTVDFLQDLGPPLNTPAKQDPVNNLTNGTGPRSFGGFRNGSISRVNGSHSGPIKSGSFEKPQESVPDFLGLALPSTNGPLDRIQSIQLNAPKTVHFADVNTKDLLRHDSDSGTLHEPSTEMGPASHSRPSLESIDSSGSSSSSTSNSKSKNHTRRSWGQGIGGNDILGIQGLA